MKAAGLENPAAEARQILCSLLQCQKAYLFSHDGDVLDNAVYDTYMKHINSRAAGKPLQHITGKQEFMSLDFEVNGDVLIPRQDTEILVEAVISRFSKVERNIKILDMCTGSGCIAVSLAHYLKSSLLTAADVSPAAIAVAARNATLNNAADRIEFIQTNLFENITGKFDVIVSNPPYIPKADIDALTADVRDFEPRLALDGGIDGLDFYRRIISDAPKFLACGGMLSFETGFDQAFQVADLMSTNFSKIEIIKDLSGINRVVLGWY